MKESEQKNGGRDEDGPENYTRIPTVKVFATLTLTT